MYLELYFIIIYKFNCISSIKISQKILLYIYTVANKICTTKK